MSSRYQKQFTIPPDFPQLLKQFSREILRAQPENIYEFGARYFAELVEQRNADLYGQDYSQGPSIADLSVNELEEFILQLFMEADGDHNGYLDRHEFKLVMQSANLGLSKKDIRAIMAECDENDDGVIEYREFMPLMVQVVQMVRAKQQAEAEKNFQEAEAREAVEVHLLHGMPRDELENIMKSVFVAADSDGSGALSRKEFKQCLKSAELGLTRKDINLLMAEADMDGDGNISYDEFMPLCFDILVERFKEEVMANQAMQSTDELAQLFLERFAQADADNSGKITQKMAKRVLGELSEEFLGLTKLQLLSIMSESAPVEDRVDYAVFAPVAASMVYTMVDLHAQSQRATAIETMARTEGAQLLRGLSAETVKQVMALAFEEADADGTGTLDRMEVISVLQALGTGELQLKPQEIHALMAAVDENDDGDVRYSELVDFMYDVLLHLEREQYVQQVAFATAAEEAEYYADEEPAAEAAEAEAA
eukprot:CAMPEP_0182912656 /NCGR_PEP_ID=MMETSP0034_2-20130328/37628_1 /TAXON_ID=156128 /ORGANISM="Nephroselmis pyriformis, Strain CCMP717" /LENGTH=481 /DNA_ID=CAMNT_0025049335 /DNA_START=86 /DNA_END=1527 /DNA_ORIENTATION=-